MPATKEDILKIANKICEREIYIGFSGESESELTLTNLVSNYLQTLSKNQENSLNLNSIFREIFPTSCEISFLFYNALVLISSLSTLDNPKVDDYENFLSDQIINITINLKDSADSLLAYCSKCISLLFKSNNQLYVRSIRLFLTSNLNYSRLLLNQIDFPPFESVSDVQDIAKNLVKINSSSPELTTKIIESFIKTDPSNIPARLETNDLNFHQTLIQFLFSIIKNEKSSDKFTNIYKNKAYIESILQIANKYFSISSDESLIPDFISFLKSFKLIHHLCLTFTPELFSNIKPSSIEQAYDIIRALGVYSIHHLNSPTLNSVIDYLKDSTDYCISNIVVDDSSVTSQFVNYVNSEMGEVHIYPYKKIERLCFYLFFKNDSELRRSSIELLQKVSQLFEKENSDWKDYEFSAQPLYRQLTSELASYIKKNSDFPIEITEFLYRSSSRIPALKHIMRRFSNNRPDFCAKIIKDCLQVGDLFPFMVLLLFTVMTPYLLRQKCSKKIEIKHSSFFNLARANPEALTMLDPSYMVEYLAFVTESDIELFVHLTKSGVLGIKSIKKDQIQAQIDTFCRFYHCTNPSLVSQALLNITAQLETIYPQDNSIDLKKMNETMISYLVTYSLLMKTNPLISTSFLSYSNFLIKNGIDYKIAFIENCDIEFFEKIYNKYPSKKEDIIFEALHFIPSIVARFFLDNQKSKNESASSVKPEITAFLLSKKSDELIELFQSKYDQIDPSDKKNVISMLNNKQKNILFLSCLQFLNSPFVEEIGERAFEVIYMLKDDVTPISKIGKETLNSLYLFFFKHPNISPRDLFFENEEESYRFFKHFVELGASDVLLSNLLKKCPYSKAVSENFLNEEWSFIENKGNERVNESSIKAFNVMIANEEIADKLPESKNLGAYHFYLRKIIDNAIKEKKIGIDFFAEILSNKNQKLDYNRIVDFFISDMTEQIRLNPSEFDCSVLNSFFEICTVVVYLCDERIIRSVYNFIDLVLNDDFLKEKLFDQDFAFSVLKLSMIDDSFFSIITENKMKIKIPEFINLDDDKEAKFWFNAIFRKFDAISQEDLDFILSCVEMALEFNSLEMKQRCVMILSLIMPEKNKINEIEKNLLIDFLQFLVLSVNVDEKFAHHIALFIDETLGPFELKLTDVDIQTYRNKPDDVRDYFSNLLSDDN